MQYDQSKKVLVGVGRAESKMLQTAISEAELVARQRIATQIESRLKGYQSRLVKESGFGQDASVVRVFEDASKQVVSATLRGSVVVSDKHRERKGLHEAEVQVEYPRAEAEKGTLDRMKRKEAAYSDFVKTKVFEDMEREVREFEEWKRTETGGH